jgi:RNA polymerase sigma-70 factor (ECF subfamily)
MTRRRDEEMARTIFAEHGRAMQLYATRLLGDAAAAEDVVQEALIRIWRHPEVLTNGQGSVRGWLLTTVRNIVISRLRARAARPPEIPESPASPAAVEDHASAVAASVTVHAALDTLSPEHRAVIEQVYLRGRDLDEVAAALGVPKGTVKSRAHYALRALRRAIRPEETWERQRQ